MIQPYVNPESDATALDTMFFTDADKVRFDGGKLRKIKGWQRIFSKNQQRIIGAARNIFSFRDKNNAAWTLIGTHRSLYALKDTNYFYNITPLKTETQATPLCFTSEYNTGVDVLVTTVEGSNTVTLTINQYLNSGDQIQISGVSGTINGIPAVEFNKTFNAYVVNNNTIQLSVISPATSSGIVSVNMNWATGYLFVDIDTDGDFLLKGDRIKFTDSTDVANILANVINSEHIISNVVDSIRFVVQTGVIATSLVENGGGSGVLFQRQIPAGNISQNNGFGYGGGQYGSSEYGSPLVYTNQNANTGPRVWSMDKWQDSNNDIYIILTPGDIVGSADETGANLYAWDVNLLTSPTLISNAPKFVKWTYVSNNLICTLGGAFSPATQSIPNFFANSDIGNMTNWTPAPGSYAYFAVIDQANAFISQATARGRNMLFTEDEVYLLDFVDKPNIWAISKLMNTDGIMASKARVEIEDAVLWMGKSDFFVFDGTSVDILPNNTLKRSVFDNINNSNYLKCFAHSSSNYNEIWFFWVKGNDNEPNNYVMYNYQDKTWCMGTMLRTASQEPFNINEAPYMIESNFTSTLNPTNARSYFFELIDNPLETVDTSQFIDINITGDVCYLKAGDYIKISGAVDTNGIPAAEINGIKQIVAVLSEEPNGYGEGLYGEGPYGVSYFTSTIISIESTTTAATSSGNGGGSSITVGTSILGFDIGSTRIGANETITVNKLPILGGMAESVVNVRSSAIRYANGNVIEVNNNEPQVTFSTSNETIQNDTNPLFEVSYYPSDRLFQHEVGLNAYNTDFVYGSNETQAAPMLAYATTNMLQLGDGDNTAVIYSVYPDTNQVGNLTLKVTGKLYPQSNVIKPSLGGGSGEYTITPTTTKVDLMFVARQRQYSIQSNEINGNFLIGKWFEEVKPSSTR